MRISDWSSDVCSSDLLTPRQWSIALTIAEFASADFVGDDLPYMQRNRTRSWLGVNWMRHTGLPGKGTASAVCFTYHKNALGHGSGADVTSDITWHGDRAAHFVNNMISQDRKSTRLNSSH